MFHLLGVFLVIGLAQVALSHLGGNYGFYFDPVALLVVFGGTVTVAMISYPMKDFLQTLLSFVELPKKSIQDFSEDATQVVQIANAVKANASYLKNVTQDTSYHELLRDGADMIISGLTHEELRDVITERIYRERQKDEKRIHILKNLAKYPPAFGLIGTVLGLINMMRGMGTSVSSAEIGLKMALALIATLYGLLLANFLLIPLAEHLAVKADNEKTRKELILEGLLMISEKRSALSVQEMMNSYLEKTQKIDILGVKQTA